MKNWRLNQLVNMNRGIHIKPLWEASLEHALGDALKPGDFVDIANTVQLKARFFELVKSKSEVIHLFFDRSEFERAKQTLKSIGKRSDLKQLILFSSVDNLIGAVKVDAASLFSNIESVWDVVGEDLSVASPNLEDGFCLERNYYNKNGQFIEEGIFELTAWGQLRP